MYYEEKKFPLPTAALRKSAEGLILPQPAVPEVKHPQVPRPGLLLTWEDMNHAQGREERRCHNPESHSFDTQQNRDTLRLRPVPLKTL